MNWEERLAAEPENWGLRFEYAQFLEDEDRTDESDAYRWIGHCMKFPGPPCVQEADGNEATWFVESKSGTKWGFPHYIPDRVVKANWCLPTDIFARLDGYINNRRDGGHHNQWAKSWPSRREAEKALVAALPKRKRNYRSIDDKWQVPKW